MINHSIFLKAQAARDAGAKRRCFDWDKAAMILKTHNVKEAIAGLKEDMYWTAGMIFKNGKPLPEEDTYCYLSSVWATPVLVVLEGDAEVYFDCYKFVDEADYKSDFYWPKSALNILED